jgi:hypothetical protein
MKEVELKISDESIDGVFAISLVDRPAIEEEFILLSKIDVQFKVIDELKREVVGLVLVPNKRILRMMNGEKFNIYFSEETIAQTQLLWMKNNYSKSATLDHEVKTDGVTFFESWIVEDEKQDKSNLYNLNAKKGSWVIKAKIENNEVLEGIKDGTYNGFSIEGKFDGLNQLSKVDEELELIKDFLKSI